MKEEIVIYVQRDTEKGGYVVWVRNPLISKEADDADKTQASLAQLAGNFYVYIKQL